MLSGNGLIKKLLKVLGKPKTWNGRPASAEYFADAALKYKSEKTQNLMTSNSIIFEIGTNKIKMNDNESENVTRLTVTDTFDDFLRSLGR